MTRQRGFTRRQMLAGSAALGAAAAVDPRFALAQAGSVLRVRSYADLQVLDPGFRKAAPEEDIMRNIFPSLVAAKPGSEWGWELNGAEAIKQIDDKTIEFRLKPGMVWTGGFGEVTADDVKFSYERIANPDNKSPYKGDWSKLDRVEVKDKLAGTLVLKEPYVPLWSTSLPFGSGNIVSRRAVEAAGGKFDTKPPAMCGPYLLKDWQPKQKTVLARNPDWPGARPDFDEVHILPIEDEKTAELGFEGGQLDYTWVSVSSIPRLSKTPPRDGTVQVKPSLAYVWLGMNQAAPPFDNPKVRRAVQHGIDVKSTLEAAYFGVAEPSTGIVAPGLPGHRGKNLYDHDPAKAKALLKEAGHANGFECTLSILNKTERVNAAQAIQASLAEIGVKVVIQQHDSGTFWSLGDEKSGDSWKKLQLLLSRFSMQPDPSWATVWFTPEQIGVWNWERFNSAEYGELHKQGVLEADPKKRHEMYVRMQDLMEESGSYVFFTHEAVGLVHRKSIIPALMPNGNPIFHKFKRA